MSAVIDLARVYDWRVAHFRPAQTAHGWRTAMQGDKGFPDLTLAWNGWVLFVELKSDDGRLTPDQEAWASALGDAFYLWRPRHWHDGTIEAVLRRR
jgi:VRR-NUC domain